MNLLCCIHGNLPINLPNNFYRTLLQPMEQKFPTFHVTLQNSRIPDLINIENKNRKNGKKFEGCIK